MEALSRRAILSAGAAMALPLPFIGRARAAQPGFKLGCLTDLNGPYSDLSGRGSVGAIRLAIEDFARLRPDIPVELSVAEFGLKPDVGLGILQRWLDVDGVDAVLDIPMSALALAAARVFEERNKVGLVTSAATSELTRGSCGPNHIQFSTDTYALAASLVKSVAQQGGDTWFFVAPNYELGKSMVSDAMRVVGEIGAKTVGSITYAFPGTTDFSSVLLQAQSSGAKVLCLANAGEDLVNSIKQAREFGLPQHGMLLAIPFLAEPTIHSVGLEASQGCYFPSPFYWDRDAGCRAFSDRMAAYIPQRPNKNFANGYSGAMHYLQTAAALGVTAAKADGRAVVQAMKAAPVQDALFGTSPIREDGMAVRDLLLLRVKAPGTNAGPWDYCEVLGTLPGAQAARPVREGGCRLVRA